MEMQGKHSFVERLSGAATLNSAIYKEIGADITATWPALMVVLGTSGVAGIVVLLGNPGIPFMAVIISIIGNLISFVVWATVIYIIGTKLFPTSNARVGFLGMLRSLGFANAPQLFAFASLIPTVGQIFQLVIPLWGISAMVVAVKQSLDFDTTFKAVGVVLLAYIPLAALVLLFLSVTAGIVAS
ncbi:MAG: hypothetical protein ACJ0OL_00910 [Dehalococcoidia bacterium]